MPEESMTKHRHSPLCKHPQHPTSPLFSSHVALVLGIPTLQVPRPTQLALLDITLCKWRCSEITELDCSIGGNCIWGINQTARREGGAEREGNSGQGEKPCWFYGDRHRQEETGSQNSTLPPPKCWDYRCAPTLTGSSFYLTAHDKKAKVGVSPVAPWGQTLRGPALSKGTIF